MSVTIHIPTPLLRYSEQRGEVVVEGATMRAAFGDLFDRLPQLEPRLIDGDGHIFPYLILLHGTQQVNRKEWGELALQDGDEIEIVPAVEGGGDVRMKGFKRRSGFDVAREYALSGLESRTEAVGFDRDLAGRILAEDVTSTVDVPAFARSAMDGYAIQAQDSFGASVLEPVSLRLIGESMPGATALPTVAASQACRIMTGAPLPPGADAVVMAEDCEEVGNDVRVTAAVAPGKHVGQQGEDIRKGTVVLPKRRRLRPQDVGLLASIGHAPTNLVAKPRVVILVTGNELLAPGERPRQGYIVDSNTPMLRAFVARDGGLLVESIHLADEIDLIRDYLASVRCDVLLCAGGSSVGREDFLPQLVKENGDLPIHGVAMRPSAPTGIGRIGETKVFLLPGNPVSCLCAYDLFCGPALRQLAGLNSDLPYSVRRLKLSRRIASQIGRLDYVRIALQPDGTAQPIALSGAALLSSTTRALGFCLVSTDSEGIDADEEVDVFLFDGAKAN